MGLSDQGQYATSPQKAVSSRRADFRQRIRNQEAIAVGTEFNLGEDSIDGDQIQYRSVFERLQSPTNYTGTQKNVHTDLRRRRKGLLSHTEQVSSSSDLGGQEDNIGDKRTVDQLDQAPRTPVSRFVEEYTRQDVFKRLQQTETKSYSISRKATIEDNGD